MQAEPSVLPRPRADVEAQVQAAVCQPGQPRPSSPVKGETEAESVRSSLLSTCAARSSLQVIIVTVESL